MKFTLSFVATLIAAIQVSAFHTPVARTLNLDVEARAASPPHCGDPRVALPLLRAYNSAVADHFYTTDAAEMKRAVTQLGYTAESTTGYVFSKQQPSTVPFYRLYNGVHTDHFYTTSARERDNAVARLGYTSEGTVGFIYPNVDCGGLPLYRSYQGTAVDHFYTMSAAERDSAKGGGWAFENVAGYMFPY